MKYAVILTLILLSGFPCSAQGNDVLYKQEIVELAHKADEKVSAFEQANQLAKRYVSQTAFEKGVEFATSAHKVVIALSKNAPSAYASTELLIVLNQLAINAANGAQAIYHKAMVMATSGQTVSLDALAAADSLTKAQSALTEVSEAVGHATLPLIAAEEK